MYRGFSIYKTDVFFTTTKPNTLKHIITKTTLSPAPTTTQYKHIYHSTNKRPKTTQTAYIQLHTNNAFYAKTIHKQSDSRHRIKAHQPPPKHTKPTASRPTLSNITTPKLYIENYQSISKNRRTNQTHTHSPRRQPQATRHHIKESRPPQPHHRTLSAL